MVASTLLLLSYLLFILRTVSAATHHPCTSFETCGALYSKEYLQDVYYSGLRRVSKKATTQYCKQKIEYEFMKHFRALADESVYPFENVLFESQCKNTSSTHPPLKAVGSQVIKLAHNDTLQLMPNVSTPIDPSKLSILYIMLVHNHPDFAVRIVNALDETMHHFVLHVDAHANDVHSQLQTTLAGRSNIHLVEQGRETISWGGFSIVNATLTAVKLAWKAGLHFDYMIDISGTTYPLKSNNFIRRALAHNPNAVFMETYPTPVRPEGIMWNQFVECDGALHRIARLAQPRGINMHVSSQWFAVPRHYVHWLLHSALGRDYIHYAQYIIIADENYFATMFHNSPYCQTEIKKNLVFLLFDKWEHERNTTETGRPRDQRKCLGVGDNNCGRSPTTLTMEFKTLIGSSRMLFARKFDPASASSMQLVDFIDNMRNTYGNSSIEETEKWDNNKDDGSVSTMIKVGVHKAPTAVNSEDSSAADTTDTAVRALSSSIAIAANPAIDDEATVTDPADTTKEVPASAAQCLTYTSAAPGYIRRQACDPANPRQWFQIGRCTVGYALDLHDDQCPTFRRVPSSSTNTSTNPSSINSTADDTTPAEDVFCSLLIQTENKELCVDIAGENSAYRTPVLGYDCTGRWNQLFKLTDNCTIMAVQPGFIGRVRGKGDKNIVSCLDARHESGVVLTAECEHLKVNTCVQSNERNSSTGTTSGSGNATTEVEVAVDGGQARASDGVVSPQQQQSSTPEEPQWQQFQFMPASGEAYKAYMGSASSGSASNNNASSDSDSQL